MNQPIPAVIAFFALGVVFFSALLLLLFNPRSPVVRWWTAFQVATMLWLASQGWAFAAAGWGTIKYVTTSTVHLMPALFLGFALSETRVRWGYRFVPLALGILLLPVSLRSIGNAYADALLVAWHVGVWGTASVLLAHCNWAAPGKTERGRVFERAIGVLLLTVAPISLVGGILLGQRMWIYVMPLLVVWIQILIFVGVAYLRFYDIDVRAARTGELAAEAAEHERLAVLGELSASLAHEIRNPLTGMRSLAQRLAEEEIELGRRRRYAGVILDEVGRLERLVGNLLGVARRGTRAAAPVPGPTDLAGLFDDLMLLVRTRAERAGVRLEVAAEAAAAAAPREPLAQALLNLLLNALRHAPAGSTVVLIGRDTAGGVELVVRDAGPGVPPAERERIFEPFVSTADGSGLGLAVVRRLARDHGWAASVGEAPGGGAEFRVYVPGAPAAAPAAEHAVVATTAA